MRALRILLLVPAMLMLVSLSGPVPASASVAVGISVGFAPPALPVYVQPPIPGPGYIWTPGYWAWGPAGYYWAPGIWVLPPAIGLLWTPPWWGWAGGVYVFNAGYWGPFVGFYGGIDYGFGYFGHGYDGGYWSGGRFVYNREVNNIAGANITNVYSRTVTDPQNHVSFNGGTGGINAQSTAQERTALSQRRSGPTSVQQQQVNAARSNHGALASVNHGQPSVTTTSRPGRLNSAATQGATTSTGHNSVNGGATTATGRNFVNRGATTPTSRNFISNGSTAGHAGTTVHSAPRNFGATARGVTGPRFTQRQPSHAFSQPGSARFGAGRNAVVPRGPSPTFSRAAPGRFGAGPVAHAPARAITGGGSPRGGGHPAVANPRQQRQP